MVAQLLLKGNEGTSPKAGRAISLGEEEKMHFSDSMTASTGNLLLD